MEELLGSVREVPVTSGDRPSLFWSSRFWCCTLLDPLGPRLISLNIWFLELRNGYTVQILYPRFCNAVDVLSSFWSHLNSFFVARL
jgi:hypothetical protein